MTSLALTVGALEVGILLSTVLFGVVTVQAFLYAERNFKDPLWLRILVGIVWSLETIQTIVTWIHLYSLTVTNYGRPDTIVETHQLWALLVALICSAIIGAIVQNFFGYRVRVLSGRLLIPIMVWIGGIVRVTFAIMLVNFILRSETLPEFLQRYHWAVTTVLVLPAVVDVLNTSTLCYYLSRRRSGYKPTQRLVDQLMIFAIETGLLTSLCAVAQVICSFVIPDSLVLFSLLIIYPKLFSNSFFTSLNRRTSLRQTDSEPSHAWSTGDDSHHFDTGNNTIALQLSPRQYNNSQAIPARVVPPSFEEDMGKVAAIS